jgi:hypothetical protein
VFIPSPSRLPQPEGYRFKGGIKNEKEKGEGGKRKEKRRGKRKVSV